MSGLLVVMESVRPMVVAFDSRTAVLRVVRGPGVENAVAASHAPDVDDDIPT